MSSPRLIYPEFLSILPTPQGRNSPTFHPPPLDGSLVFPELYHYNAEHSPEHPLFVYADGNDRRTIKYPEAWRLIQRAAKIIHGYTVKFEENLRKRGSRDPSRTRPIGILANADTISYASTILGTMSLGLTPFPLSIRNSPIAIAHLVKKTDTMQVFVSPDPAMQRLCHDAVEILRQDGIEIEVLPMIQFDDIEDGTPQAEELDRLQLNPSKAELSDTAIILHSSGTTSFPKPVYISHRTLVQWTLIPFYGQIDACGMLVAIHTSPMFHAMGFACLTWSVGPGMVIGAFKPSCPPVIPTPEAFLSDMLKIKTDMVTCVPSFIEAWVKDPDNVPALKTLGSIAYGGAPITKAVGEQVTAMGVKLYPLYGLTETWCITRCFSSDAPTLDTWEWWEISPHVEYELLPEEDRDDIFELAIIEAPHYGPCTTNATSSDGRPMYRTFDLLQRHPRYPNKWRIHGRSDDQIMLATGEKTNPGPLEAILQRDPHVAYALMFGRGQIQNGILVDPKPEFAFDPLDEAKLIEFRNMIWPTVEKMNEFAPAHSRLFKEMIIVSSPSKPFEFTSKGTPRRHYIINKYEPEIKALYETIKESSQTDIPVPEDWDERSVQDFVREVVQKIMDMDLPDDIDFFQQGCDSLQATYIRNAIMHAVRQPLSASRIRLPNNFVYANPTISSLSSFVFSLFSSHDQGSGDKRERDAKAMEAMLEKYSADFPVHRAGSGPAAESLDEVVMVSGTSGRLGAHLLAQLLEKSSVKKVYAVNRPSKEDVRERQKKTFENWELNAALLESGKAVLVEADFAKPFFGLSEEMYSEIRDSVTSIIHNAWRVDFNLSLSSFEPLVAGMRNIIDMSLSSPRPTPPPILFTSSISVIMGNPTYPVPEEPITETKIAASTGYSESKWVSESLLLRVREERGLCTNVVRVGQLSGDLKTGGWNKHEWVPVMLRGSQVLGAVPQRVESVSFIPVDTAASSLLEMIGSSEPVLHLVHPYPVPWTIIAETASRFLHVPIIPYSQWLSRLQNAAHHSSSDHNAVKSNPALKLLEFFEKDMPEVNPLEIGTTKAVTVSESLRKAKRMDRSEIERWMEYWKKVELLQ